MDSIRSHLFPVKKCHLRRPLAGSYSSVIRNSVASVRHANDIVCREIRCHILSMQRLYLPAAPRGKVPTTWRDPRETVMQNHLPRRARNAADNTYWQDRLRQSTFLDAGNILLHSKTPECQRRNIPWGTGRAEYHSPPVLQGQAGQCQALLGSALLEPAAVGISMRDLQP